MASIERKLDVPVVKPNKGRLFGLDMRKAVAILMVIALHTPLVQPDFLLSNWPESTAIRIFQYCLRVNCEPVPFFVFIVIAYDVVSCFKLLTESECVATDDCLSVII